MKTLKTTSCLLLVLTLFMYSSSVRSQETSHREMVKESLEKKSDMKTFLIEREIPQAGIMSSEQLKGISQKSCTVLNELGTGIEWIHSYVTQDKVYCIYKALNEELIEKHAEKGGFPVSYITELSTVIDPTTAK